MTYKLARSDRITWNNTEIGYKITPSEQNATSGRIGMEENTIVWKLISYENTVFSNITLVYISNNPKNISLYQ